MFSQSEFGDGLEGTHKFSVLRAEILTAILAAGASFSDPAADSTEAIFTWQVLAETRQVCVLEIVLPRSLSVESHGHCAVLRAADECVAEIYIESSVAVSFKSSIRDDGHPVLTLVTQGTTIDCRIIFEDFKFIDRGIGASGSPWKRYRHERDLWYLIEGINPVSNSAGLLVVFSALAPDYDFSFNYRKTVANWVGPKLFILDDFGARGSYYLMDHRDEGIFGSVQSLILEIASGAGIELSETVFCGSSKGGTAALIHGLSLGVGEIWCGAPQIRVGDYLHAAGPEVLAFMTGAADRPSANWLNRRVESILVSGLEPTRIRMLVGAKDHHLVNHAEPFVQMIEGLVYDSTLLVVPGTTHAEVGAVFSRYVSACVLSHRHSGTRSVLPYELSYEPSSVNVRVWVPLGEEVSISVYGPVGLLRKSAYQTDGNFVFDRNGMTDGLRLRVFRRVIGSDSIEAFTTAWY